MRRLEPTGAYGGRVSGSVFSHDSSLLLVWGSRTVRVLSSATGHVVRVLDREISHGGRVTSLALHPLVTSQLYACSTDGTITLWDYTSGALIKTISVGHPLFWMSVDPEGGRKAFVLCVEQKDVKDKVPRKTGSWKLLCVFLKGSSRKPLAFPFRIRGPHGRTPILAVGCKNQKIAVANGKTVEIFDIPTRAMKSVSAHQPISAIALHPTSALLAIGDSRGQIGLCGIDHEGEESSTRSKFHWHSNAVTAIVFPADGQDIISGGQEGVVVVWNLESRVRRFFPRLGQTISSISTSPDCKVFAAATSENDIYVLDTSTALLQAAVRGVYFEPATKECYTSLACRGNNILLPHPSGSIFLHNIVSCSCVEVMRPLGLASTGKQQRGRSNAYIRPISHMSVSPDGSWIVVAEGRLPGCGGVLQAALKFWEHHADSGYLLKDQSDLATGEAITSLAFSPSADRVMSASSSRHIKFWTRNSKQGGSSWVCDSVGYFQDAVVCASAFSADGSLLLLGCERLLVLWDPVFNSMLSMAANLDSEIRQVAFVGATACAAVLTESALYVLDVRSCTTLWSIHVPPSVLLSNSSSDKFALALSKDKSVVVLGFSLAAPVPEAVAPLSDTAQVIGGTLLRDGAIVLATESHELITLGPMMHAVEEGPAVVSARIQQGMGISSVFAPAVAQRKSADKPSATLEAREPNLDGFQLLDTPSHTLPSPAQFGDIFLASLLPPSFAGV